MIVTSAGLTIHVDPASAGRLDGTSIDFVDGPGGAGFKIVSPNEPARVKLLAPKALKAMLDRGEKLELFDVRGPEERQLAAIAGARPLDEAGQRYPHGPFARRARRLSLSSRRPQPEGGRALFAAGIQERSTTSRAASTPGRRRSIRRCAATRRCPRIRTDFQGDILAAIRGAVEGAIAEARCDVSGGEGHHLDRRDLARVQRPVDGRQPAPRSTAPSRTSWQRARRRQIHAVDSLQNQSRVNDFAIDETLASSARQRCRGLVVAAVFAFASAAGRLEERRRRRAAPDGERRLPLVRRCRPRQARSCARDQSCAPPLDVIGNDWFVLEADGAEPSPSPGPLFAAAVAAALTLGEAERGACRWRKRYFSVRA